MLLKLLLLTFKFHVEAEVTFNVPLIHKPHIVSSGRWSGNDSSVVERRLEAMQMREEEESSRRRRRRLRQGEDGTAEPQHQAPLYEGIGTHYAHVYVGTPPQRVSVIMDTGSHHTAFPCKGCTNCGTHTDKYFDPGQSSTSRQLHCSHCASGGRCVSKKCQFSQSYTEGSSWKAYQTMDKVWFGGMTADSQPTKDEGTALSVEMMFGCQYSETGLFRTQKADGIMGLSANPLTILPTLREAKLVKSKAFSLCLMKGGGMFSIGGTDPAIHHEPMKFVPLSKSAGWFTVHLESITLGDKKLEVTPTAYNSGKGTIVDSGTTDTYLTRKAAASFKRLWKAQTGTDYGNVKMVLTDKKFQSLPVITFTFKDAKGEKVDVHMKPDAYMEKVANKYVPRVYLSEGQGAVLGANFMQDHDVFFDEDGKRVGFARSDCSYSRHLRRRADYERNISNHSRLSGVNVSADAFMNDEMAEELSLMEDSSDWTVSSEWDMRTVSLVLSGIAFAVTFGICSYMQKQSKYMLTS